MSINIFNLPGPSFLLFYLILGIITLYFARRMLKDKEAAYTARTPNLTDPYEIAYLRAGKNEAVNIATFSLIDRGLLETSEKLLVATNRSAIEHVRRPIEIAILKNFSSYGRPRQMYRDTAITDACAEYKKTLEQHKLIADETAYEARRPICLLAFCIIVGFAAIKMNVALESHKNNIIFLVLLAIFFLSYLYSLYNKTRTGLGDIILEDLQNLFQGLNERKNRIKPGGETNEAALLAGVFGISALYGPQFPYLENLFPNANKNNGYSCSSSCASCGSSGCGGGGGCSGGCGGCGGD